MLKQKLPGVELQNIRKKLTLFFKSTADDLINDSISDSNDCYQTLLDTVLPLRQMMEKTSNYLDDNIITNIKQVNSIPIHLLTLVSMWIDGPGVSSHQFSQPSLTIAQLIQTNFRKNKNHDIRQSRKILKKKETPVALYSTFKIYGTLIENCYWPFFQYWTVLSYDRILDFTKNFRMPRLKVMNLLGFFRQTHYENRYLR